MQGSTAIHLATLHCVTGNGQECAVFIQCGTPLSFSLALAPFRQPSYNAGTLARWCKGSYVVDRNVFGKRGASSCTKTNLRGFFRFLCVPQNAGHIERGKNKEK